MSIYDSELWINDLDEAISEMNGLEALCGKSVLITGATGLICSAIVDLMIRYNETHDDKITIYATGRSPEKLERRFRPFSSRTYLKFVKFEAGVDALSSLNDSIDYIIHGAGNATPGNIIREPVETMTANIIGLKTLLDYVRDSGASRLLYISSSEVYGLKDNSEPFSEDEYGYIDILNARNSYSVGKRAAETLCISHLSEYNIDTVIARPGHVYGPTASPNDNRVSSAWAYMAAHGEDLVMKSNGAQIRSYCYCIDCATAILTVLLKGESGSAYNISNPTSVISIKDMAELISRFGGVKLISEAPTEHDRSAFNPMTNSSLDSSKLISLGWRGLFDAERGFEHTIGVLRGMRS